MKPKQQLLTLHKSISFRGFRLFNSRIMPPNCSVKGCSPKYSDRVKIYNYPKGELIANEWIIFSQKGNTNKN